MINRPERYHDIYHALALSPLTANQLLRLSSVFPQPFTSLRRVQETLRTLAQRRRINCHRYTSEGPGGGFIYYTLTPATYRDLFGDQVRLPPKSMFRRLSDRRQRHTFLLAEVTVHIIVSAHQAGISIERIFPENGMRLDVDNESVFPDRAFDLIAPGGKRHTFFGELDNNTKSIFSIGGTDTIDECVRKYLAYARANRQAFRVPIWTTGGSERVKHILDAAASAIDDPNLTLVYAIHVEDFLNCPAAVTSPCFRDHRGRACSLVQMSNHRAPSDCPELAACQA